MTREELLARLAGLRQARVGQIRVPHKPLLLLWLFGQFAATGSCCRPRCLHMVRQRLMPAFRHAVDEGAWVVRVRGCWGCSC